MKRRLIQLCFALGLLLTLTAGTMWVRGFWLSDMFSAGRVREYPDVYVIDNAGLNTGRREFIVTFRRHAIRRNSVRSLSRYHADHLRGEPQRPSSANPRDISFWRSLGFQWDHQAGPRVHGHNLDDRLLRVPAWFVLTLSAGLTVAPCIALVRGKRRRLRKQHNLCPTCGYDLQGANHERCPECGTGVEAARV